MEMPPRITRWNWSLFTLLGLASANMCVVAQEASEGEGDALSPANVEFFEKKVRPLLVERCFECHSGNETNGGLSLESRSAILKGGDSGPALVPRKPEMSRLIEAVRYGNEDLKMPPKNRLSEEEVAVLEKWVSLGAPDPRVGDVNAGPMPVGMSIEDGRNFWSFRPLPAPVIPDVKNTAWVRTPIDAFLLARLESTGLQPAPPVDKRTLLRRVTFDLIGLPPTVNEVDVFLADDSPQAYARVVDRLLQSPHYGVRWGRHWLDVARYADSNGLDENLALGNAWRYRDYVVDAFNNDKPYDRFLVEQLAGDLIPNATIDSKAATGFLVLGAKVLAEPDRDKLFMDTIDEQLDSTGKVFMGLTLGCVRCHDHKFDPLKQTDYYALAAIFKSTRTFATSQTGVIKHWHEYEFATDADRQDLAKVNAEIGRLNGAAASYKNQAINKLREVVRAQATEYLVAATKFAPDATLTEVQEVAAPQELHPRVLHHCRLLLDYSQDHPFFTAWHSLAKQEDAAEAIDEHYRALFTEAETALAAKKKADPKATTTGDPRLDMARAALLDASGFLTIPAKPDFALDEATMAEYNRLMEAARVYESNAPDVPAVMGVGTDKVVHELPIHIRGSHLNLGDPIAREFPEVMRTSLVRPIFPADSSGRLELARWMASSQHPLTARVYVNRIWNWHFGGGIVRTTENFGQLGDRPSHPALLDWLARDFIKNGWSTKELHRQILLSSAYQMSVTHPSSEMAQLTDSDNRLLWKFPLQRLDAEQIRDSILSISGRLDYGLGGKTVPLRNRQFVFNHTSVDHTKYDSLRRAIYLPVIRNNIYAFFEQFDFPDPTMPTGRRNSTVVAPQALLMMNSQLVMQSATEFATRILAESGDESHRVRLAYTLAFGRPSSEARSDAPTRFWKRQLLPVERTRRRCQAK
jgi:hypothetical protein